MTFPPKKLAYLEKKYGVSPEDAERTIVEQEYRCAICQLPIEGAEINADHCHVTGEFRAFLCSRCNMALGLFYEDPQLVRRAACYLMGTDCLLTDDEIQMIIAAVHTQQALGRLNGIAFDPPLEAAA
jgi:Recombination endonuclease VII